MSMAKQILQLDDIVCRKICITALLSALLCNPNGDPDNGGEARRSGDFGIISPGRINYMIRYCLQLLLGQKVYMLSPHTIAEENSLVYQELGLSIPKGAKDKDLFAKVQKVKEHTCANNTDVRIFGAMMDATEKTAETEDEAAGKVKPSAGSVTGPFRVHLAQSIDPIELIRMAITRQKKTNDSREKGNSSEMGVQYLVKFGLYRINIVVSPHFARETKCTYRDVLMAICCVQWMCEMLQTSSKAGQKIERIDIWNYEKEHGYCDAAFDTLKIAPLSTPTEIHHPLSMSEYDGRITLGKIPPGIYHHEITRVPCLLDYFSDPALLEKEGMKIFLP